MGKGVAFQGLQQWLGALWPSKEPETPDSPRSPAQCPAQRRSTPGWGCLCRESRTSGAFTYSFMRELLVERPLCAWPCVGSWGRVELTF